MFTTLKAWAWKVLVKKILKWAGHATAGFIGTWLASAKVAAAIAYLNSNYGLGITLDPGQLELGLISLFSSLSIMVFDFVGLHLETKKEG